MRPSIRGEYICKQSKDGGDGHIIGRPRRNSPPNALHASQLQLRITARRNGGVDVRECTGVHTQAVRRPGLRASRPSPGPSPGSASRVRIKRVNFQTFPVILELLARAHLKANAGNN
ncbi:hypothetical protein EYF80_014623 [Liparis tanakae]|uniref:Uncharacterized protein n=1 Tax=Liparis tanakae TaxID=230148 RepID=A0A4Z2IDY6_9TELE|nr:hypothetical protein EYF80_014623 [Liparis tanakae]